MRKINLVLVSIFLLIGIFGIGVASAEEIAGVLNNVSGIYVNDFAAGSVATANFSFNYQDYYGDSEYSHILQINITSNDSVNYPVWKNDFEMEGFVRKYTWFGFHHEDVGLKCSENSPLTINHPLGSNTLDVPNGTFYCYNETGGAIDKLSKHDEVYLTIQSNSLLWPGKYNISAKVYYLEDTTAPMVNILNKDYFENNYFNVGNSITVNATIADLGGLNTNGYGAIVLNGTTELARFNGQTSGGVYYFPWDIASNMGEGNYTLLVFAEDNSNNTGNDTTILKIDTTAPNITLVQPNNNSIHGEILPIKFNVTDAKSGVDNNSVKVRLREILADGGICPKTGGTPGGVYCVTTPWINLAFNSSSDLFEVELNTTEYGITNASDGAYWLDAQASDILNNSKLWIA